VEYCGFHSKYVLRDLDEYAYYGLVDSTGRFHYIFMKNIEHDK